MNYIKDSLCTARTPVILGAPGAPVYGKDVSLVPAVPGKRATRYEQSVYLEKLLPLEEYSLIIVLLSDGKDSAAAFYRLLELGVPKEKIECWHHDIDGGGNPARRMDWPVTQAYVRAFAEAEGVKLRTSWRVGGFFGELYRVGASFPIEYEDGAEIKTCRLSPAQIRSEELRGQILRGLDDGGELAEMGYRMKFPAKSGDLARRWCSAYLKIIVADTVIRNMDALQGIGSARKFPAKSGIGTGRGCLPIYKNNVGDGMTTNLQMARKDIKILIVSGKRRAESSGRAAYNEMEIHRTNATAKAHRLVHQWRNVIGHSERDVWEILRRHNLNPHPAYACGWNRCSCRCGVFSLPKHWAGIKELFPGDYRAFREDEVRLGFTLDNKKNLDEYTAEAASCVDYSDARALKQLVTGEFTAGDVHCKPGEWHFPSGAFQGGQGGPC